VRSLKNRRDGGANNVFALIGKVGVAASVKAAETASFVTVERHHEH
jgi:hypothetical protein